MARSPTLRSSLPAGSWLVLGAALTLGLACVRTRPAAGIAGGAAGTGAVDLALVVAPDFEIAVVTYQITGNGITPITGSIDVARSGASVSLLLSGLPAGTGYSVQLQASGIPSSSGGMDPSSSCLGGASFDILANATSSVAVALQCTGGNGAGTVIVNTGANRCPVVDAVTASPISVGEGGTISLMATASDPDPGAVLSYLWSSSGGGIFGNRLMTNTTFLCSPAGTQTLRLTVNDGQCAKSHDLVVACTSQGDGGVGDASAELPAVALCNDCVAKSCAADDGLGCSTLAGSKRVLCDQLFACVRRTNCAASAGAVCLCGTSPLETCVSVPGSANGSCRDEELAAAETSALAQVAERFRDPLFASGVVHNRLSCEQDLCPAVCPPNVFDRGGGGGSASGGAGGAGDAVGAGTGGIGVGGDAGTACEICGAGLCAGLSCDFEDGRRAACESLLACMRRTGCATTSTAACWCGSDVEPVTCASVPGAAHGPCLAEELAAAESTVIATIAGRYADPNFASGRAHERIACEQEQCPRSCPSSVPPPP